MWKKKNKVKSEEEKEGGERQMREGERKRLQGQRLQQLKRAAENYITNSETLGAINHSCVCTKAQRTGLAFRKNWTCVHLLST